MRHKTKIAALSYGDDDYQNSPRNELCELLIVMSFHHIYNIVPQFLAVVNQIHVMHAHLVAVTLCVQVVHVELLE
jgi:hypothetical protein